MAAQRGARVRPRLDLRPPEWGGLPDSPWYGTVSTLTAAATGHRADPARHVRDLAELPPPGDVPARPASSLDDISGGRILCGIGTGGDLDSRHPRRRAARRRGSGSTGSRSSRAAGPAAAPRTTSTSEGSWFSAVDARTLPGPVQRPRTPFIMAANGPRSLRLAARFGARLGHHRPEGRHARGVVDRAEGPGRHARRRAGRAGPRRERVRALPQPRLLAACSPWPASTSSRR